MKNIVLTGFMGVGKTTVGKRLADVLEMKFVDTDEEIEKETGKTTVQIFESEGEKFFREKEAKVFKRLIEQKSLVISTGGGTFENKELREICKDTCTVVCLASSFENIMGRIDELKQSRPLLQKKSVDEIKKLYDIRMECYLGSDLEVNIDGLSPDDVVEKILRFLRKN